MSIERKIDPRWDPKTTKMTFTPEEWAEVEQEVPKTTDSVVQQFLQGREKLLAEEKKQRSDYTFRQSLTPIAKRACEIVNKIRAEEHETVWSAQLEEHLAVKSGMTVHPGMMFTLAKDRMETTKLWKIVRKMPKGCLLHAHLDAMVDFGFLLDVLMKEPGMHISSPESDLSTKEKRAESGLSFSFLKEERGEGPEIWNEAYEINAPIRLTKAADAFPDGGRDGFLKWLKSRCTLSPIDAVEQHHGVDHIWRIFAKCFVVVNTIIHYEPIFRQFLRRLMMTLHEDGIKYSEIRFTWPLNYHRLGSEIPEPNHVHMFQVLDEEINAFKASPEGKGFWGLRMIWTSLRSLPSRLILEDMDHCISTKMMFPHLIAGYDLVGPEDLGRPLKDLLPELLWFRQQATAEGVNLPFFFHAGETLGDGTDTDNNIADAILLGTRRLGHAFSLYKHPLLIDLVKEKRILVESCPISNEVLRLCASILSHPLPALLARGVHACLCNDDPAMLGHDTAGSTHDFAQALQGWENLGMEGLGALAENSIRWACFEDQTNEEWIRDIKEASLGSGVKAERLKEWAVEWEKFCLWVVEEFSEDLGDDAIANSVGEGVSKGEPANTA